MADSDFYDELAAALAGAEKEIYGNTWYDTFSDALGAAGNAAVKVAVAGDDPDYGLAIGSALGTGLFGGALDQLGEYESNQAYQDYADLLFGKTKERPDTLSEKLYQKGARTADILQKRQKARQMEDIRDRLLDVRQDETKTYRNKIAGLSAEDNYTKGKEAQYFKDKAAGKDPGILNPIVQKQNEMLDDLRQELIKTPEYRDYSQATKGLEVVKAAIDDPHAVSDTDLIFGTFQIIEPGGIVREGEQALLRGAQSLEDKLKANLVNSWRGDAQLLPETRQAILRLAKRRYNVHAGAYENLLSGYTDLAKGRTGLEDAKVSYLPAPTYQELEQAAATVGFNPKTASTEELRRMAEKLRASRTINSLEDAVD